MQTASWVIRRKATAEVLFETFDRRVVDALNAAAYEAVPIGKYLASLNSEDELEEPDDEEHDCGEDTCCCLT